MTATDFEPMIGLEVHVQLLTASKAFTAASAAFGGAPNSHTDPYTLGLPGTLPVLNWQAVEFAMRLGLAAGCRIRRASRFARKHYFYPDLPKGYQISQYDEPLCEGGAIEFLLHGERRRVRLIRIHMEEDAGKNLHAPGVSLLDLNRAGVPLVEVVSEPDLRGAEEAAEYLRALRQLVRYLGISNGNMEEGSLRCDVNVSVRPRGSARMGTRTELKNINSIKFVHKAIEHEIARQVGLLRSGDQVMMETRGWNADRGTSHSQRGKEEAHDYRYMPDPDLPPLVIDESWLARIRGELPETPLQRCDRYEGALGLSPYNAGLLTAERAVGDYFDTAMAAVVEQAPAMAVGESRCAVAKALANWLGSELLGVLNRDGLDIAKSPVAPDALAELVLLVQEGTISGKTAKELFQRLYQTPGQRPRALVAELGLTVVTDTAAIEEACHKVVAANPKQSERYRTGQEKLLGFFVGQVMRETGGRAKPNMVNEILRRLLVVPL